MKRKCMPACLSALLAMGLSVAPTFAADVAGKWYGETDVDPVIIIDKVGSEYSGSLVDIDTTRRRMGDNRLLSIHKSLLRLNVTGGNVRFTIAKLITENGDGDYQRDQYNLNLTEDGLKLVGTISHMVSYESGDMPRMTMIPITLFPTDWNSRQAAGAARSN